MADKFRVAVLMGGPSFEHEISLSSGQNVLANLDSEKYEGFPVVITRGGGWRMFPEELREKADLAFIAMHGQYGEDGRVQDVLEQVKMPYTGSGVLESALGMNQIFSSKVFDTHGFLVPSSVIFNRNSVINLDDFDFSNPIVVKPATTGSSLGVSIVRTSEQLMEGLKKAFGFSRDVLVQEYIPGREVTCGVIEDENGNIIALEPTEIIPGFGSFFDYSSKYHYGGAEEITPARLPDYQNNFVKELAKRAHRVIGAFDVSRTDMIVSPDGRVYVLEINTIPGMTPNSLLPRAAEASGMSVGELLDKIIGSARRRYGLI